MDGKEESQEVPRLKSVLESLGIDLSDDLVAKMVPRSMKTTSMERILAGKSVQGGDRDSEIII